MTSDLCEDGGEKQREKETSKASSVCHLSAGTLLELPGPWTIPLSPVTPRKPSENSIKPGLRPISCLSWQEAETRPLRSPPGLSFSFRSQLDNDNMNDWLHLVLEADHAAGELRFGPRSNVGACPIPRHSAVC